jgi:hypothetical protein
MLSDQEIRGALRASIVMPLGVASPHGPLGLEHLAAALENARRKDGDTLAITLRPDTREKLERLARRETAAANPVTAAEVAAAIVEQYMSAAPLP